jgi:hypothetical protein
MISTPPGRCCDSDASKAGGSQDGWRLEWSPMAKNKRYRTSARRRSSGVTYADVVKIAREMPEVEESTSYGTPALKVGKVLLARLKEDGETLVLKTTFADRERLLKAAPDVFHLTDHYLSHPWILVRLPLIEEPLLRELLTEAWRLCTSSGIS